MRGVVPSSGLLIQFNCPNWSDVGTSSDLPSGLQCVDGLQRYTAVKRFLDGEIKAFGLNCIDFAGSSFDPGRFRMRVAVLDFTSRADLIKHYLSINAGGTPHSSEEIERVRALLIEAELA